MLRQTVDLFRKNQFMDDPEYEIYNYSDAVIPKVFPHRHEFYEMYYLLCDQVDYSIGNQIYHLKKGDLLLIPPGLLHFPSEIFRLPGENYARVVFWCNPDFFQTLVSIDENLGSVWDTVIQNRSYHIHPSAGASSHIFDLFRRLLNERQEKRFASRAMVHSIILEIFAYVGRLVNDRANLKPHTPTVKLFDNMVYYIHVHLMEELSLEVLADQFFVSKGYISRMFREYMGIPAHQYILSLRLEGCRRAIHDGAPIQETANLYGFADYTSFYRAFKAAFLKSPSEYQKECAAGHFHRRFFTDTAASSEKETAVGKNEIKRYAGTRKAVPLSG